ncbi:MAG: carboxyltransferase domain-containing protein [Candidatus Nanopelagicales bacterium]
MIARRSTVDYRVACSGFAPGFAYLSGLDPRLVLPRRESPRAEVPAGSVAIAAQYSAA